MISLTPDSILLSIPVAQALLAFTGKSDRIGINDNNICATNGNVALRFHTVIASTYLTEGSCWSHEYVKRSIAMAKAVKDLVSLGTRDISGIDYPNQKLIEPPFNDSIASANSIGVNAEALALLEIVSKACAVGKTTPPAVLVTANGPLSPLRFTFGSPLLQATVTIMPTRY